jgi:hypothetical protein
MLETDLIRYIGVLLALEVADSIEAEIMADYLMDKREELWNTLGNELQKSIAAWSAGYFNDAHIYYRAQIAKEQDE